MSNALKRMALRMAAFTAPMMMGGDPNMWRMPKDLAEERQVHGYQSKGHYRRNDQQKKRASNLRVAKRRTQNKASRKARRKQRR